MENAGAFSTALNNRRAERCESAKPARGAGWPREVALPGLPQIRTCGFPASGSSESRFATCRTGVRCAALEVESASGAHAWRPRKAHRCANVWKDICARWLSLGTGAATARH